MSKFNTYARQANELARGLFAEYDKAREAFNKAYAHYRENKRPDFGVWNATAEKIASAARAEADYVETKDALENARKKLEGGQRQIEEIKRQLLADIEKAYMARPDQLDANAMELIRSGILKPNELSAMLKDFKGNPTMARMIGAHAKQRAAEADAAQDGNARAGYLVIASEAEANDGSEYVAAFDYIADVFRRCVRTPDLAKEWDNLTARVIENF